MMETIFPKNRASNKQIKIGIVSVRKMILI